MVLEAPTVSDLVAHLELDVQVPGDVAGDYIIGSLQLWKDPRVVATIGEKLFD